MSIRVRYFASVREALGAGESVEIAMLASEAPSVADVRDALITIDAAHAAALGRDR